MFSGEETDRQKKIRRVFKSLFTPFFGMLMYITRFNKFMQWQEKTGRRNQMIIFITMGLLIFAVILTPFFQEPGPTDESAYENREFVHAMNKRQSVLASPNQRVVRLAQLLDSLKVDRYRLESDTAYLNKVGDDIIKIMYEENLMDTTRTVKQKTDSYE